MTLPQDDAEQNPRVRPIARENPSEVGLVAERMRLTLMEVLGPEAGRSMYTLEWLEARVRWHLDPNHCRGEVFVVERGGVIEGHVIVRLETEPERRWSGLISTIYVAPESRRRGLASLLVERAEQWLEHAGARILATHTSESNTPLIRLFEGRGYEIVLRAPDSGMVRLERR